MSYPVGSGVTASPSAIFLGRNIFGAHAYLALLLVSNMLSSDNDSVDGSPPRWANSEQQQLCSPRAPTMPNAFTTVAGLVQSQECSDEWRVRAGDDLPKFLTSNGPARITRYNFKILQHNQWPDRALRRQAGSKPDLADIFELTSEGSQMASTLLAWRVELACTASSEYGKPPPNCQRTCCGGFGACRSACSGGHEDSHSSPCSLRVLITATLADVAAGYVTARLTGMHVPPGVEPQPPPVDGLKPAPFALRKLREECASDYPTRVVNKAVASLGEGAERNTRLAPPARVLAGCKKRDARTARGGSMDDATRIDMLVRCHLIQRGMVLLYIPGMQLVLTTPWALEQARLALMISVDAKIDSVTGARSKWTSVGGKFHP